jgi:fatty acid desaturase
LVGISYGWWQSKHNRHHANPNKVGADPDIALPAIAFTPERATRHRSRLMRWLVARQGWYFFPILLLEGASLHADGIRRVISREKIQRRWVEISLLTLRLGGLALLVFLVLPPEKGFAFLAVRLAVFGLYMGSSFAPNHIGMPLVSPEAGLLASPGPDEPQHQRRIADLGLYGWTELSDRAPPVPLYGATLST